MWISLMTENVLYVIAGGTSYGPAQQSAPQLSPNRNVQLSVSGSGAAGSGGGSGPSNLPASNSNSGGASRTNIFNQRPYVERRMQGLGTAAVAGGPMVCSVSFYSKGYQNPFGRA